MRTTKLLLAYGATLLAAGERIYVDNSGGADISVIDPATNSVTGVIRVSKHPHGIVASRDKSRLYVSSEQGDRIFWATAVVEPMLFAVVGLALAARRRRG